MDPFKVKAVDTTGAGDAFVGALLTKIVNDHSIIQVNSLVLSLSLSQYILNYFMSIADCEPLIIQDEAKLKEVLKYANACGAITTTKKGAIPALPTPAEVNEVLKGK